MPTKIKRQPVVYIIAGPNGSGKTTFAKKFLPKYARCTEFINADLLAQGLSPFAPDGAAVKAGRLMLKRIEELSAQRIDFAFETTLAGRTYVKYIRKLKSKGYKVHLFFLWLPKVDLAIARVASRVKQGGHNIPEPVIRRRFRAGVRNLFDLYRPLLDAWTLFDNSGVRPRLISSERKGQLEINDKEVYNKIYNASMKGKKR